MKKLLLFLLCFVCSPAWADCDETLPDLTKMLSRPLGHGEVIAIVKGTISPGVHPADEEIVPNEVAVEYFNVIQSYGLIIPPGKYMLAVSNNWGMGCIFYEERPKYYNPSDVKDTVYLALSRVHSRTLVLPEGVTNGLYLDNKMVVYLQDDAKAKTITLKQFERHVFKGISPTLWKVRK